MSRWTCMALAVIITACVVTLWYWSQLLAYTLTGLPPRKVEPELLMSAALPTAFFLGAALLRQRSARMQRGAALAAAIVALLQVLTIRSELAREWTHGTGVFSFLALGVADMVALIAVIIAAVGAVRETLRERRRTGPQI